jgi:hypothetical protein
MEIVEMPSILESKALAPTTQDPPGQWLTCRVDKGMFSNELAVTYPPTGEHLASVFVPIETVVGRPGELGKVLVQIVRNGEGLLAVLPTPWSDVVPVAKSDVSSHDPLQHGNPSSDR